MGLHERFWAKVDKRGDDECWEWTAAKKASGYGMIVPDRMYLGGSPLQAHRVSWEIHFGDIPDGVVVHHTCFNKSCVNPRHLELLSYSTHNTPPTHQRALATHCRKGHSFENALIRNRAGRNPFRLCRTCYEEKERQRVLRRRAR